MSQSVIGSSVIPIDPDLLGNSPVLSAQPDTRLASSSAPSNSNVSPPITSGKPIWSQEGYQAHLLSHKRKDALQTECTALGLTWARKDSLERLRGFLTDHWYPSANPVTPPRKKTRRKNKASGPNVSASTTALARDDQEEHPEVSDADLLAEFGVADAVPEELLGYDDEDEDEEEAEDLADDDVYAEFQKKTRIDAAERFEGNRRAGGRKTQKSMLKSWDTWFVGALARGEVRDGIVDEHSLLCYMKHSAERPKLTSSGAEIPDTRIGASQLKKLFFGALRHRKTQEAADPTLKTTRPCATVVVYDDVKTRMDLACQRERSGLTNGDAPDIVANTFLAQITDKQLQGVGYSFLEHRELHQVINGHLSWTCQNASGNRGDDFRALKLCEMQPYIFLHPNKETSVYCVLGLQGEEKAGKKGMKTVINPSYTTFIAHRNAEVCPLGAMAFYHHWLHDHYELTKKMSIDWAVNKSWRNIRLLFGSDPTVPYNENSLYNLYCLAYKKSDFEFNIKQHLPRHMLGYLQERMGVDPSETAKLGWSRGTYMDTYAPALPKVAILGTHGYKVHENYDPIWRHVRVPETFLRFMCPDAESILENIEGVKNLTGASNYWQMIIELRPYLFQCAAAIFQIRPKSALFRLPALKRPEVQTWMKDVFPVELKRLKDSESNPLDLSRIQNEALRLSLEEVRAQLEKQNRILDEQSHTLAELLTIVNRRTALLSPAKGYSSDTLLPAVTQPAPFYDAENPFYVHPTQPLPHGQPLDSDIRASEDTGVYELEDGTSLRAFISPSPTRSDRHRSRTAVDLILPPKEAFNKNTLVNPVWSIILGKESVMWSDVFRHITDAKFLYDVWKPSKTLNDMTLTEIWNSWSVGEVAFGDKPGQKPPIRLIEQHFKAKWRPGSQARKFWERYREIPEWIESQVTVKGQSPEESLRQLEALRVENSTRSSSGKIVTLIPLGVNALSKLIQQQRKDAAINENHGEPGVESSAPGPSTSMNVMLNPSDGTGTTVPAVVSGKRRAAPLASRAKKAKTVTVSTT
ncbi:hypothetical protein C8R43DRAFT_1240832 [Mycena crocata]|nr:hypothetical protein C8R43DRAFT_1240832 [Mycena crocata]